MIESDDYFDPHSGVQVFSLYGKVRRPTDDMMKAFDVLLFDLQDVGCRVYTYLTTLLYLLEASAAHKKEVWVLDRPNPAGRPAEGFLLDPSFESFVGASRVPLRHGLTMGEMAKFLVAHHKLNVNLTVVPMAGYSMTSAPGFGWPEGEMPWVNPSPNMPLLCTARVYTATVLLEGVNLSEGRGTTRPLQIFGAPGFPSWDVIKELQANYSEWLGGCTLRPCFYEPTFHKFKGELCEGLEIHVDAGLYNPNTFRPYRLMLAIFKSLNKVKPGLLQWRQPPYEYEHERLPIDLLNGSKLGREWVDDPKSSAADLERILGPHEKEWLETRKPFLLYS